MTVSDEKEKVPWLWSCRLILTVLGFLGFFNVYTLRVNMSVAIVCMVNQTALAELEAKDNSSNNAANGNPYDAQCVLEKDNSSSVGVDGTYMWDRTIQGHVLGAFYWGYLVTQVPGGWLATKFGGKRVYGWAMFLSGVATLLTPLAADVSYIFLIVIRVFLGLTSGVFFPAMHALLGNWAPPLERSKLSAFIYAGSMVGTVVTFPMSGLLCEHGFAGGWPSIFYILGTLSLICFFLWMFLISDTPAKHKRISKAELHYIEDSLKETLHTKNDEKPDVPWKSILTSFPFYAILAANVACDWGGYTLISNIPTYMLDVLKFNITANGFFSALPYIALWITINFSGWLADFLRAKHIFSTSTTRKIFEACGKIGPAALLIALGYMNCTQSNLAIVVLVFAVGLSGFQYSGFLVNCVDIAPPFAGILLGITNSISASTGFLAPFVVGVVTDEGKGAEQWRIVFYIAASVYVAGALIYIIFGSGELQSWAKETKPEAVKLTEANGTELKSFKYLEPSDLDGIEKA